MLTSPFDWQEDIPGAVQSSSQSFAPDAGSAVLVIRVAAKDLQAMVQHLCGWSEVVGPAGLPATPGLPYFLSRTPPARHPRWQNMFATKILSCVGVGTETTAPMSRFPSSAAGKVDGGDGVFTRTYGNWNQYLVTIQFELPLYPILSDQELGNNPEYFRYVTRSDKSNIEIQSRPGAVWNYPWPAARAVATGGAGNIGTLLKTPKASLKWTWHDVHEDWLLLGKLLPTNSLACVGSVNLKPFPFTGWPDQNVATNPPIVQCPPGTLLLQPVERKPRVQMHPAVQNGEIDPWFFPRTYDVDLEWVYFNPPTDDLTSVILNGSQVLVRGHNLVPLPCPTAAGFSYYTGLRIPPGLMDTQELALLVPTLPNASGLAYQYVDHELLFSYPRSQGDPVLRPQ